MGHAEEEDERAGGGRVGVTGSGSRPPSAGKSWPGDFAPSSCCGCGCGCEAEAEVEGARGPGAPPGREAANTSSAPAAGHRSACSRSSAHSRSHRDSACVHRGVACRAGVRVCVCVYACAAGKGMLPFGRESRPRKAMESMQPGAFCAGPGRAALPCAKPHMQRGGTGGNTLACWQASYHGATRHSVACPSMVLCNVAHTHPMISL